MWEHDVNRAGKRISCWERKAERRAAQHNTRSPRGPRARTCVWALCTCLFLIWGCVCISISMRILICNYYEAHLCSSSRAVTLIYSCVPQEATLAVLRAHSHTISHSPNSPHSQSRWRFNPALSHTLPHTRDLTQPHIVSLSPLVKINHGLLAQKEKHGLAVNNLCEVPQ